MSDFEDRLRAADPAAASSYEHPDTERDDLADHGPSSARPTTRTAQLPAANGRLGRDRRGPDGGRHRRTRGRRAVPRGLLARRGQTQRRAAGGGVRCGQKYEARHRPPGHIDDDAHLRGVQLHRRSGPQRQRREPARPTSCHCPRAPRPRTRVWRRSSA